jgi:uncharacterized protein
MPDPVAILKTHYREDSLSYRILLAHSTEVARMSEKVAQKIGLSETEVAFIREASLLHDIGIFLTSAPGIGCTGEKPYICHGYLGHDLLLAEGLPVHALVCERHTGTGLSLTDLKKFDGLLPQRPMVPVSLPERIIAYCDKFFSKDPKKLTQVRKLRDIIADLERYGPEKVRIFNEWHDQFHL